MNSFLVFELSIAVLLLGSIVSFLIGRDRKVVGWVTVAFMAIAAIGVYSVVITVFTRGPVSGTIEALKIPLLNAHLFFRIDYLSALFLAIIALISVLASLYATDFMLLPVFENLRLTAFYPVLFIFFASVMCVVSVSDIFFFLFFWEVMTLTSYFLVIFRKNDKTYLRAGFKYFLINFTATSFMFLSIMILYTQSHSFAYSGMTQGMQQLMQTNPRLLHLVLLFFFLAFATKAGILPMGDWLPDAYPAAPAPGTSAFAGSMTKLGIYGIVRIFCDILPVSDHTQVWGLVIALFGTLSIFVGTLTALVQEDTKKLLSFHVIGQMGYMFLGIGIGTYFLKTQPILAVVGIGAGVFHLVNHVCYKACLFFNAGSVYWKVGTRDLNKVGGLSRLMPLTAITTIIASLAIAGIPPFSGFSSKWLIYQAAIKGGISAPIFIGLGIIAIFISAVTLASFIKFFSSIFFGKYADNNTRSVKGDVPITMMIPQVVLAFLCVFFGIVPLLPVKVVYAAITNLFGAGFVPVLSEIYGTSAVGGLSLNFGSGVVAGWNPILIILVLSICGLLALAIYKSGNATARVEATWYCGEIHSDEEVRYRAHGYYLPFKKMFALRIGKYEQEGVYPQIHYPQITFDEKSLLKRITNIDEWLFKPIVNSFMLLMEKFSATHVGIPHVYLLWQLIGTIAAIIVLFSLTR